MYMNECISANNCRQIYSNDDPIDGINYERSSQRASIYNTSTPRGAYEYYLDEQADLSSDHLVHIQKLHQDLDPSVVEDSPRIVVAIPVAGHQESGLIKHTLAQYSKQVLPKSLWEVILFVNAPATYPNGEPISIEDTLEKIAEARQDFDLPNLRVMHHLYDEPQPIGKIRKDLWDTIVYDMHTKKSNGRTLVINNDSDTVHLRNDYISEMAIPFVADNAKQIKAPVHFESLPEAPIASKLMRYHWHMYRAYAYKLGAKPTFEGNSAFDLATYCAIGGFDPTKVTGEYNDLHNRVQMLDSSRKTKVDGGSEVWTKRAPLKTSSRRQLATMALGRSLAHTWDTDTVPFTPYDNLRVMPPTEAAEIVAKARLEYFITEDFYNYKLHSNSERSHKFNEQMDNFGFAALSMMGLFEEFQQRINKKDSLSK
jgi:hypothetical protein